MVTPSRVLSISPSAVKDDARSSSSSESEANDLVDDGSDDDVSISLGELMLSDPTSGHVDQSSIAGIASPNSSRETIETSTTTRIPISAHELANRHIKAQQRTARRTQARKTQRRRHDESSLGAYLQQTRPVETCFDESNGTLVTGLRRSVSEKSLLEMEKESVSGQMFVLRKRSNSFGELPAMTPIASNKAGHHGDIALCLDNDEDDTERTPSPPTPVTMKRETNASLTLKQYCDIADGCSDEDSYLRRARGRRMARQQSVRDATAGRAKRNTEIRRRMLRKECSVSHIKKADDFLRADPADTLKDLVDSWKEETQAEAAPGSVERHLKSMRSSKPKRLNLSERRTKRMDDIREQEITSPSASLKSHGTSETSMISSDCSELFVASTNAKSSRQEVVDRGDTDTLPEEDPRCPKSEASFSSSYQDADSEEDDEGGDEEEEKASVIIQFDTSQEGNVSQVRLDKAEWCLVAITYRHDGALMEGHICKLPEIASVWQTAQVGGMKRAPLSSSTKMLWKGPSTFFERRSKAKPEPETALPGEKSQFDDLGRIVIPED